MKNNDVLEAMNNYLKQTYGHVLASKIYTEAKSEWEELCLSNDADSKDVKAHTELKIYPMISLYHAMQNNGINKDEACNFLDKNLSLMAEKDAKSIRTMLTIPFAYRLMPKIFKKVTLSQFGEKAGFKAKFYDTDKTECKFDMQKCLYCEVCNKYNCFELVKCFCHTDDVTDGNMHPRIHWNRTKTMGEGDDVCDFDITIK